MNKPVHKLGEPEEIGAFQAKTELSRLLRQTRTGKRFIITHRGEAIAELGPIQQKAPASCWGDLEGLIQMSEDFDDPVDDFQEYMR